MKEHITISVSSTQGSRHFRIGKRFRYGVWGAGALLFISGIVAVGFIAYLQTALEAATEKQLALAQQSREVHDQLAELQQQRADLEGALDDKDLRLTLVSERLDQLEQVLGGDSGELKTLEDRLDVATINSVVRRIVLDTLPSGSPVKDARRSSRFGVRKHPVTGLKRMHRGLDFAVNTGTPVYAPADGVVSAVRPSKQGSGNYLRLRHAFGFTSSYSHLKKFAVRNGDFVNKGDLIAYSGNSGLSSGPHLHYEVRFVGRALDPAPFVDWEMDNFEQIFEKERNVKWVSLINKVTQRVSLQVQLSSQKDALSRESSS
ncbi:M23 family metallopeptidase [Photobacterium sp. TY1-4]|uniref:M23 family metallopeptidase n=1 Tax=Photobacterium sp. TY1-4 TaxID=2899122 RepID=UPI0021BF2CBC|nr:M23 family metallopeptidase [Photobacterium sp. TY1-4]UXI02872.1 peptidoglycan DD-metalloendopeptidase family protein [Photobacterium sp. TY1-4]